MTKRSVGPYAASLVYRNSKNGKTFNLHQIAHHMPTHAVPSCSIDSHADTSAALALLSLTIERAVNIAIASHALLLTQRRLCHLHRCAGAALSCLGTQAQRDDVLSRISFSTDRGALADCDLVIEAITENPEVKLPLYRDLGQLVKPSGILASNTSSLRIEDMARSSGRADRVVGLHFFNPVQVRCGAGCIAHLSTL
jgi:3-hydroxyacyl-CoA dehydrogenase, NAD binding domain